MAKKSNKTSHVLNLLTNRTGLTADELEQSASAAAEEYAPAEAGTAEEYMYAEGAAAMPPAAPIYAAAGIAPPPAFGQANVSGEAPFAAPGIAPAASGSSGNASWQGTRPAEAQGRAASPPVTPAAIMQGAGAPGTPVELTIEMPASVTIENPASITIETSGEPPAEISRDAAQAQQNIPSEATLTQQDIPSEAMPEQQDIPSEATPAQQETPQTPPVPPAPPTGDIIADRIRANLEKLEAQEAEARAAQAGSMPAYREMPPRTQQETQPQPSVPPTGDNTMDRASVNPENPEPHEVKAGVGEVGSRPAESAKTEGEIFKAAKENLEMSVEKSIDNVRPVPMPEKPSGARIEAFTPEKFDSGDAAPDDDFEQTPAFAAPDETPAAQISPAPSVPQSNPAPPAQRVENDSLIMVNIIEEIVHTEAMRMMIELGMCRCERCQMDVKALALNNIAPKYVVSRKGALFAQISTHINQNKADILAQVTKACILVQKAPSHC